MQLKSNLLSKNIAIISNLNIFPDYGNATVIYTTENIPNNTAFSVTIPETAYYIASTNTYDVSMRPLVRIMIGDIAIWQGYNASGNYMYLYSPPLLFKKGTVVTFQLDSTKRNILKIPICTEIWEK